MINSTQNYYKENNLKYAQDTYNLSMKVAWTKFSLNLAPKANILDAGCGSGRDSNYFISQGFTVTSVDPVKEFNPFAKEYFDIDIVNLSFQEITYEKQFDGIWACASLLHVPMAEMGAVFGKLYKSLKTTGVMYCSFKYGVGERQTNGRHFTSFNEESFQLFLEEQKEFAIKEIWVSKDVRQDRKSEKWLNVMLYKGN